MKPNKSDFIISMIEEVEAHEAINHWTLMKNSQLNNKRKINMVSSRLFYPFGISIERHSQMED